MIHLRAYIVTLLLGVPTLAQPARVVSTFPSITDTIFALGAGDRVVGVSNYCHYPPAVLSLPKVGTYTKPDPEKIALLRPDLVIIQKSSTALADRLSSLGIRHVEVKVGSLAEIYLDDRRDRSCPGVCPTGRISLTEISDPRLQAIHAETRAQSYARPS